jgi:hypothetical protein
VKGSARKVTLAPTRIGVCSSGLLQFALGPFAYGESFHESAAKMSTRPSHRCLCLAVGAPRFPKRVRRAGAFRGRTTAPAAEERDVRLNRNHGAGFVTPAARRACGPQCRCDANAWRAYRTRRRCADSERTRTHHGRFALGRLLWTFVNGFFPCAAPPDLG